MRTQPRFARLPGTEAGATDAFRSASLRWMLCQRPTVAPMNASVPNGRHPALALDDVDEAGVGDQRRKLAAQVRLRRLAAVDEPEPERRRPASARCAACPSRRRAARRPARRSRRTAPSASRFCAVVRWCSTSVVSTRSNDAGANGGVRRRALSQLDRRAGAPHLALRRSRGCADRCRDRRRARRGTPAFTSSASVPVPQPRSSTSCPGAMPAQRHEPPFEARARRSAAPPTIVERASASRRRAPE